MEYESSITCIYRMIAEQVTEEFRVTGRRVLMVWTVREREATRLRVNEDTVEADGTNLDRAFVCALSDSSMLLPDRLVLRRWIEARTAEALLCVKALPERRAA